MSTAAQVAANRANAQKSTGPTSEEGKAKSSANRLSHGFASNATIMPGEDPEEFKALLDSLVEEHQPATDTEQILVEKMATNQWLSLRAFRLQGYAFVAQSLKDEKFGIPKELSLLMRYHSTAERAFHRAHNELVKTQKERKKSEIGFVPQKAKQPPASQPKSIPITWVGPDSPSEPAAPDTKIVPETREFVKSAA